MTDMNVQCKFSCNTARERERIIRILKQEGLPDDKIQKKVKGAVILNIPTSPGCQIEYPVINGQKNPKRPSFVVLMKESFEDCPPVVNGKKSSMGVVVSAPFGEPMSYTYRNDDGQAVFIAGPTEWAFYVKVILGPEGEPGVPPRIILEKVHIDYSKTLMCKSVFDGTYTELESSAFSSFKNAASKAAEKARTRDNTPLYFRKHQ